MKHANSPHYIFGGNVPLARVNTCITRSVVRDTLTSIAGSRRLPEPPVLLELGAGAESSHGRPIGWRGQTEGARRQRDHGHRVANHVKELNGAAFLGDARNNVALHDRPDIARVLITAPVS